MEEVIRMDADKVHPLKVISALLQYPTDELFNAVAGLDSEAIGPVKSRQAKALKLFIGWYTSHHLDQLQSEHVETFDFTRQNSLHLTYHLHGDSRQRGLALLKVKTAYTENGFEVSSEELPDYLPMMLEFASLSDAGIELLEAHRESLELIRSSLGRSGSAYESLLGAVISYLPRLSSRKVKRIRRLAEEGPPSEEVGLEPFAPPEVMPTDPSHTAVPIAGVGR